ncbi:recombinase family protein [Frankia sp. Mgl5]|uniref:recombinase family protein n=1 Tax=Frankia sp. Mgl5 TaxID=2933793 RepID=UPI00200F0E4C|nr:recombinase family protein [Frankia sp. Mgl5]MCK9929628.1 recombinase family protein [Frankia sp. Mgl5]
MAGIRALSFTRHTGPADGAEQREVFAAACAARGWTAGDVVRQYGSDLRAWWAALRLVRSGRYDVVVVDTMDRLADTEPGRLAALEMLRCAGVRLLVARDGTDTADPVGAGLVASLLTV